MIFTSKAAGGMVPQRRLKRLAALLLVLAVANPLPAFAGCFRGINLSGAEFGIKGGELGKDYTYPSGSTIRYFADQGFNSVRLPFSWDRLQPKLMSELDKAELARLKNTVKSIRSRKMAIILDPHNYALWGGSQIGSDAVSTEAFADFWTRLATIFASAEDVSFGLMNEPHSLPADSWATSAQGAIDAIRKTGAKNLILLPGTAWTGAHSWQSDTADGNNAAALVNIKDPGNNLAYEVHQYLDGNFSGQSASCERADDAVAALQSFTDWLRSHGKRGFLGEFGGSADPQCLDGLKRMTQLVNANADVWTGWTYWVAGDWWPATEPLNIQPTSDGDRPQLAALDRSAATSGSACPAPTR